MRHAIYIVRQVNRSLVGAALLFASVLVTFFGVNLAWERAKLEYQGPLIELSISGGVPILWPAYGAVLLVLLNTPNVQRWARDAKGVEANAEPPLSRLATVSIALSLSPFAIIPQALALITGIIALLRIGRSQGALAGAGFALGGIVFSFVIIVASIAWHLVSPIGVYYTSYVVAPAVGLVAFPWICFVGRR